jgi:molybdopterin converting factor small subunit
VLQITFKLFATLSDYLPAQVDQHVRSGNEIALDVPEGTAVQAVIDRFNMPRPLIHLVLVNGHYISPSERAGHLLRDGDALAIWPPIAGG